MPQRAEVGAARRAAQARRDAGRARLHAHEAPRQPARRTTWSGRASRPSAFTATARRAQRTEALDGFKSGQVPRARRHRHRRARHRRRGARPRRQLRRARGRPTTTSIASAARRAPRRPATRSRSSRPRRRAICAAIEQAIGKRLPRVTLPGFDYTARAEPLEIPIAQRIAAIRQRRAAERPRSPGSRPPGRAASSPGRRRPTRAARSPGAAPAAIPARWQHARGQGGQRRPARARAVALEPLVPGASGRPPRIDRNETPVRGGSHGPRRRPLLRVLSVWTACRPCGGETAARAGCRRRDAARPIRRVQSARRRRNRCGRRLAARVLGVLPSSRRVLAAVRTRLGDKT